MDELLEVIGVNQTERLLQERGGQQVYIPMEENLTPDHWLVACIGMEDALAMCRRFTKMNLVLPLGISGLKNRVQVLLNRGLKNGTSYTQLVRLTGLSRRTCSRQRRRLEEEAERPKPPRLF
jgi:uncharacterized protein YerC